MKIIDCFTFYNEIELLTYRLNLLNEVVDYFIIVESKYTHVGKEKKLYFNDNKNLFNEFEKKIIHIILDELPYKYPNINFKNEEQWINEQHQRNCIHEGIKQINLNDDDYIIISDLDEITNPNLLKQIKNENILFNKIINIDMKLYYYNLNCLLNCEWRFPKILNYGKYKLLNISCNSIRTYNCNETFFNAGWHLSYFGNSDFIKNKIINFAHQEYNNETITDNDYINDKISKGIDLYGRNIQITNISVNDNNDLPLHYQNFLSNFYSY
jgi:beta-1,4-mannosyl-glycoprotein beta-1,4-N-acetylglucosaminyltransferase